MSRSWSAGPPSFRHGIHPTDHKERTEGLTIRQMPFVGRYVLPLGQHIGAPAAAAVEVGDSVKRGQVIATPRGFVSTTLHAPVSGTVTAIAPRRAPDGRLVPSIEIEADPFSDQRVAAAPIEAPEALDTAAFVAAVQAGGLVGLGGAAFPSHVKYSLPEGKRCKLLVLNGCECEPYLTCDHRTMVERPAAVLRGAQLAAARLGAERILIGVEGNKPDAITALRAALSEQKGLPVDITGLQVKYPQGAEKMLIEALTGRRVPAGKLPLDLEIVVNNVGTMASLADLFDRGLPLIERAVTVSGSGIKEPANLMVPLGTPLRDVIDACGGLHDDVTHVVMGGPMMGSPIVSLDAPVLKGTSGILAFRRGETFRPDESACIRCGRCLEACAVFLNPSLLARLSRAQAFESLEDAYVLDCMECGACTFACPSSIPIVQLIRASKATIRKRRRKA